MLEFYNQGNVAYSNPPEIFVNGLGHNTTSSLGMPLKEKVLTVDGDSEIGFQCGVSRDLICGKAEDSRG
jgi:hypothetical protein